MTDEEKRQRIEVLLLSLKDWCEESDKFISSIHDELFLLIVEGDAVPYEQRRRHWVNDLMAKAERGIYSMSHMLPGILNRYQNPAMIEDEIQRRAANQRSKKK